LKYLRIAYTLTLIGLVLTGCQLIASSPQSEASPKPSAASVTAAASAAVTPLATAAATATPPPTLFSSPLPEGTSAPSVPDILSTLYGDDLQASAEGGYRVGESTIPWVGPVTTGSFTGAGTTEWAVLVGGEAGGSSDASNDEKWLSLRWVILGYNDSSSQWYIIGRSPSLGFNIPTSEESWRVSGLTDFDQDGTQELLAVSSSSRGGIQRQVTHLFRWNGTEFAQVWSAPTYENNTNADGAPTYYISEATVNLRLEDGIATIALDSTTRYFAKDAEGRADTASVTHSDTSTQQFQWDGQQFAAFSPGGPQDAFAFSSTNGLWLWSNETAQQIDDRSMSLLDWSQNGQLLAYVVWWPSDAKGIWLYDASTDSRTQLTPVEGAIYGMEWSPTGNTLGYVQALPAEIHLRDLTDGSTDIVKAFAEGFSWAPDGNRVIYDNKGSLARYDLASKSSQTLVRADENAGTSSPGVYRPSWSPRGDLIAGVLRQENVEQPVLIDPLSANQIPASDLVQRALGITAPHIDVRWSPTGERLAVLASNPASGSRLGTIYVVEVTGTSGSTQEVFQDQSSAEPVSPPVWNHAGERLAAVVGQRVMVWNAATGGSDVWYSFPTVAEDSSVAWAPDGSGLLVSHGQQMFWFASSGTGEPVLLLQDITIDSVQFAQP